jgi:predicted acyl esterase
MDQPPMTDDMAKAILVIDVAPPAQRVTMGWLKASHRELDSQLSTELRPWHTHTNPQPLEPNHIYKYNIEIWPTSWVFKAGHRVRVDIAATDGLYFLGHMQSTDTLYHDAAHPSHLLLPVIPTAV